MDSREEEAPLVSSPDLESQSNLESTMLTVQNLGTTSLGILYVSFTFFSLVASPMVRSLGSKNALILGSTGYWLFIAANLIPSWYTMVPAALYMGFAASIIWVGQGTYLTSTARSHAEDYKVHEGTVIGKFNGEFWGMFASHQFVGNLFSLFLLGDEEGGKTSGTTLLFVVFLCIMTSGIILMFFLSKRDVKEEQEPKYVSFCSSVVSLSKLVTAPLLDTRMLLIIPLIAYSGLQQAFVWAEYTKHIVRPAIGESGVGGAMAVYGAFDAVCSLAAGRLTSGLPSITLIVSAGALIQAIVLLWILLKYSIVSGVLGVVYPLVMAAMLGMGDAVFNTQLNALLGLLFRDDTPIYTSGRGIRSTQGMAERNDCSCVLCRPFRIIASNGVGDDWRAWRLNGRVFVSNALFRKSILAQNTLSSTISRRILFVNVSAYSLFSSAFRVYKFL
ncbi:hypothetical protein Syun_015926 [Stephania yunnanensis]|uniref:UNC93-like protein 3 n=1 Tax=Stephania yunnanensis TaxID=152371 RepID=A0AAP0J473_9MAGN